LIKPDVGAATFVGTSVAGALYYYVPPANDLPRILQAEFDYSTGKLLSTLVDLPGGGVAEGQYSGDWSPDGKYLAYVSSRGLNARGQDYSVKIRSSETGEVRELDTKLDRLTFLRWAPDGRSLIALASKGQYGFETVYRVDTQTGDSTLVIPHPESNVAYAQPTPSIDGKKVYYIRRRLAEERIAFIELDLTSGKEREIIQRPFLGGLNISPDGRYILTGNRDQASQSASFLLIPVDGGAVRETMRQTTVAENTAPLTLLMWGPDSKSALIRKVVNVPNRSIEVWQVFVDGREAPKLDGLLDPRLANGGIRLHPDGRRIVQSLPRGPQKSPSQIMMLENFLPVAAARK
jgi:dipeptidyl aminopeptidase/acylaminoacyl peptidase